MCRTYGAGVVITIVCLIQGSVIMCDTDVDIFLEFQYGLFENVSFESIDLFYNEGEFVEFKCGVTQILSEQHCKLFWVKNGDEFNHLIVSEGDSTIRYLWKLARNDDDVVLKCRCGSHSISATTHRNKSPEELLRDEPNIFKTILIVLGAVVAGSITLLIGYQIFKCFAKKSNIMHSTHLNPTEPTSYAIVELESKTQDPVYSYANHEGKVNLRIREE